MLRARRRIDEIRVFALGVKPQYRRTGTGAALYAERWRECLRRPIRRAETGWIFETNGPLNRAMRALGRDVIKRYRIYERPLASVSATDLALRRDLGRRGRRFGC